MSSQEFVRVVRRHVPTVQVLQVASIAFLVIITLTISVCQHAHQRIMQIIQLVHVYPVILQYA
jgi:hypothetical protein